jgi:hypothetical protein
MLEVDSLLSSIVSVVVEVASRLKFCYPNVSLQFLDKKNFLFDWKMSPSRGD